MDFLGGNGSRGPWRAAWSLVGVLAVFALQRGVFSHLPLWGVRPDLPLLVVLVVAFLRGRDWGAGLGLAFGFLNDLQGGVLMGAHAAVTAAAGYVAGWVSGKVFRDTFIVPVAVVASLSWLSQAAYLGIAHAFGLPFPWREGLWELGLPLAAYHALLALPLYPLCLRWFGRRPRLEEGLPTRGPGR